MFVVSITTTFSGKSLIISAFLQVPSYISRSVAGSYDNEAVAIFALIYTFYLYIKVSFEPNFYAYHDIYYHIYISEYLVPFSFIS